MRRDEARAFVNAVAPLVDAVAARVEYERQMLNLRAAQVEAGLTGDFSAFNGSQDDLNAMAETVNADVDAIAATVAALLSLAISVMERTTTRSIGSFSIFLTKEPSILTKSTGSCLRYWKEDMPLPKSSSANRHPRRLRRAMKC